MNRDLCAVRSTAYKFIELSRGVNRAQGYVESNGWIESGAVGLGSDKLEGGRLSAA